MHPNAFDRLSRLLAATPTRRTALTGLLATATALVERLGPTPAWAAAKPRTCRKLNKSCSSDRGRRCCRGTRCLRGRCRCPRNSRPCQGGCRPRKLCCGAGNCPRNQVCRNGRCRCPAGMRRCGQSCIPFAECCRGCPDGEICVAGTCGPPACGREGPCRVFVTSLAYTGNLGGVGGADAKCQELADVSPLTRGGTYRAWISGGSANSGPASRFTNLDRTGPYVLTNGAEIAADWDDLVDGSDIGAPIHHTEWGDTTSPTFFAWTYTLQDGHPGTIGGLVRFCEEWSSSSPNVQGGNGDTREDGFRWTLNGTNPCSTQFALYCFEQG